MPKYRGTLHRSDLEGGHWQLETEDGTTYVLDNASLGAEGDVTLVDGVRVEIDGAVESQSLSIAMTGPVLTVKSIKGKA